MPAREFRQSLQQWLKPTVHGLRSLAGTNGLSDRLATIEAHLARDAATSEAPLGADVAPTPKADAAPKLDISLLLHQSRGAYLRDMPPGAHSMLSAGCAGLWYFEWIEQTYGRVPEHLGIEFYSPKPDGLPSNVTWIVNTVMDMSTVESARCDLVFSGQNLEHLWPEEVVVFYLEAARVLKPGGHLVVDSPNRAVTAAANWSHPEHTIELTCDEAVRLATMSGFDVTSTHGIWLCRDGKTGESLPFDPNIEASGWSVTERLLLARDRPRDAFIWWVEARRSEREPDRDGVAAFMADLFERHWPERTQRFLSTPGHSLMRSDGGDWIVSEAGQGGAPLYGPICRCAQDAIARPRTCARRRPRKRRSPSARSWQAPRS